MRIHFRHTRVPTAAAGYAFGIVIAAGFGSAGPAHAQGLLDMIFGSGPPKQSIIPQQKAGTMPPAPIPTGKGIFAPQSKSANVDGDSGTGGTFRTVCVRMCDGYFIPMSYATTRKNIYQDQAKCRASCGDDARLFYHRNPGGSMEEAIDLTGRVYGRMPNAFRYRKTLVEGCACRPPPWSEAELARHQSYVSGAPLPVTTQPNASSKVAEAAVPKTEAGQPALPERAAAKVDGDSAMSPAAPVMKKKVANPKPQQMATVVGPAGAVGVVRAQKVAGAQVAVPATGGGGGLFSFGSGGGMGLGAKPKYVWPGDAH